MCWIHIFQCVSSTLQIISVRFYMIHLKKTKNATSLSFCTSKRSIFCWLIKGDACLIEEDPSIKVANWTWEYNVVCQYNHPLSIHCPYDFTLTEWLSKKNKLPLTLIRITCFHMLEFWINLNSIHAVFFTSKHLIMKNKRNGSPKLA